MKDLRIILLITAFLVIGTTLDVAAQKRNARTASARAAYGLPAEKHQSKAGKKKKVRKVKAKDINGKNKEVKRRRRDSWAG